jgi:hypothetical protein
MTHGFACQNCLYQTAAALPQCPQCGLHNIFIAKSRLPYFTGRAPMPALLQCLGCDFKSIHRYRQCPRCTKSYVVGQSLNKLVSKGRYRGFNIFSGLFCLTFGILLGAIPVATRILYRQKILTEGPSDMDALVFIGGGLFFIVMAISLFYKAIFR